MTIVTSTYRYKRPPRKRKAVALDVSAIVTSVDPKARTAKKGRRLTEPEAAAREGSIMPPAHRSAAAAQSSTKPPPPANDVGQGKSAIVTVRDRKTVQRQREQQQMAKLMAADKPLASSEGFDRRSAIITTRRPGRAIPDGWLPDTPEEHRRRGDAADAMFREFKRLIAAAKP